MAMFRMWPTRFSRTVPRLALPAILTVPQNKNNGVIMGIYTIPQLTVGDHFQSIVSCQYGAVNCYVSFELDYLTRSNSLVTIWKFREKYDGLFYRADIDLSRFAFMRDIRLVLIANAAGPATGDLPLWIAPRIARPVSDASISHLHSLRQPAYINTNF